MAKIRRFPRLLKDYPDAKLTKNQRVAIQLAEKRIPRGYDKLTKRQKKLARYIINGMTIRDACRKLEMDTNTFYRYLHYHPLFKKYYHRYAEKTANEIEGRMDAKYGRAMHIVDQAMDNPDIYLAYGAAKDFLTGRGIYKKNIESKKQITGAVKLHGKIETASKPMDGKLVEMFIEALTGKAMSNRRVEPKVIKAKVVSKVLNQLPENTSNQVIENAEART